ncbi:Arf family guanine nucleotide exchange factor SEC7 NDAI_0A01230 [Naumovozyma dairenensis CBS 421]|uniref:SEC7 domain-containing protein n=1 Tax=Naumovozyma dairenensis (strain ATCC 10597 / BCRC 20456 / CBS 421 / NBRC 0211 / NRRL Y-12639) TaxID=1071378 RepID=G0W393_NAUDC|nr:hypothetical protein NDAI_0A01230 [Naumovozyma dairenensis CBS 421]CCD22281.1 hypothetical protein NDAI_0A01230 [Naumovozyma dairenensis CBS 421]
MPSQEQDPEGTPQLKPTHSHASATSSNIETSQNVTVEVDQPDIGEDEPSTNEPPSERLATPDDDAISSELSDVDISSGHEAIDMSNTHNNDDETEQVGDESPLSRDDATEENVTPPNEQVDDVDISSAHESENEVNNNQGEEAHNVEQLAENETQQEDTTVTAEVESQVETPSIQISEPATEQDSVIQSSLQTDRPAVSHTRNASILSSNTINANAKSTIALVKTTLEAIMKEKSMKKYPNAQKIIERTIARLDEEAAQTELQSIDSILIFEALRAACRTKSSKIKIKALDCLSKLFSFRALDESVLINLPDSLASDVQTQDDANNGITPPPKQKLIEAAIDTIAECFEGEGTNEKVELQIIRSLSSCILAEDSTSLCHGVSLLKAIRTIYNAFVFSLNPSNQGIAQATLTQVISYVFDRIDIKALENQNSTKISNKDNTGVLEKEENNVPLTLENINKLNDAAENGNDLKDTEDLEPENKETLDINTSQDLAIKDAFLVFRTMAKICAKQLEADLDMRSHAVRAKLLSLHIIYSIIKDHIDLFLSPYVYFHGKESSTLLESVRQFLCLSLTRNAASPISPVFEITAEIMWLLIANLRAEFRREIPVFLTEIYFPITELKTSTSQQKRYFLSIIQRICNDPRTLIEFYLNYDCNPGMPNIMEMIVDYLTRLTLTRVEITPTQRSYYEDQLSKPLATYNLGQLPLLTTSNIASSTDQGQAALYFPLEFALKMTSLNCIVSVLRSLNSWAHKALNPIINSNTNNNNLNSTGDANTITASRSNNSLAISSVQDMNSNINIGDEENKSIFSQNQSDDPTQFENLKLRKTQLSDCIAVFNSKPKKAIPLLLQKGFIKDDSPKEIAKWLLNTDGLDLAVVGDFLGEGDEKNIAVMHAFVDEMDFTGLSIVDGLREFLQEFRLPGEGQKIDRFMLKFAERYVDQNPGMFSKADTAYVLSYSLIMLNTDLHSSQVKNRMTLNDFLENNEGIDNGNDLPRDFLVGLYNEIANNEIKLLSEQHDALLADGKGTVEAAPSFSLFGYRDYNREAYMQVSKQIASKTELVFKNLNESKDKTTDDIYYAASHVEHVSSIFENLWMSFLAALTPPFKEYDEVETTNKCLEGLKLSIRIASIFSISDARTSFIGALVQFCNLQNVDEIKMKNINAMVILLEVSLSEGNYLKESWTDVLFVVSQLERLQLISKGIDRETVPDVAQARLANPRQSFDSTRSTAVAPSIFDLWGKKATPTELAQEKHHNQTLSPDISKFISSSDLVVLMDNIFTKSSELTGSAIVDFIKALTHVSLDEIESSQNASTPRMFSLQKMVDVCYYNMDRIKLEWTPIWTIMGNAFNKIATNPNLAVVFFAIDSLRQLSMRFLDIEELTGFEFQHDFLKPFEYTVQNTTNVEVQEMIIECYRNFILTKSEKIKSGWKTILESLQFTAQSKSESIVKKTQELISNDIIPDHFESVFCQDNAFAELVTVFKEITKNKKFQKLALHALESLKKMTQKIAKICFDDKDETLLHGKDIFQDVWFPMLFCFNDTIMTAEDLEVRSRALNYMFDALVAYGGEFDDQFWENICTRLLFPIFGVLSKHWEVNQFNSHDDLSVWLSTTLIQALRNLIALFTHYFESLNRMLDGFLGLLVSCICQENDTIARIGRSCLQQLILQNVTKFNEEHWEHIGDVFKRLFELTTASELFDYDPLHQGRRRSILHKKIIAPPLKSENNNNSDVTKKHYMNDANVKSTDSEINNTVERAQKEEASEDVGNEIPDVESNSTPAESNSSTKAMITPRETSPVTAEDNGSTAMNSSTMAKTKLMDIQPGPDAMRRRISVKNSIVVKCVLQLLMIELISELFENEEFSRCIPYKQSMRMLGLLESSYEFSRDFNEDYGLRTRLVEARVVDKIPNLLKQETSSAAVLIDIMFKLYLNDDEKKSELLLRLVNVCTNVVEGYVSLDDRTMERSINSWRPVIVEILQGYYEFDDEDFKQYCSSMYGHIMQILEKSVPSDLRHAMKLFLTRIGEIYVYPGDDETI